MKKYFFIAIILTLSSPYLFGQALKNDCNAIKAGDFYFNPAHSDKKFIIIRKDSVQEEIDINNRDTTFWAINWVNSCKFTLKFIGKTSPTTKDELNFYASHRIAYQIQEVKDKYYTFKAGLDSINAKNSVSDTVWRWSKKIEN